MMRTITVVTQTSFQAGQVILAASCLTSCINVIGFNFAIKILSHRICDDLPRPTLAFRVAGKLSQIEVPR